MSNNGLAQFVDRHTMRYERNYPHPIDLVFEAVSTGESLDAWMVPVSIVERRLGGRCSFSWGGEPSDFNQVGEVTVFDPPRAVQYTFTEPEGNMRFDLESVDGGTRLLFTLTYAPGSAIGPEDYDGGDQPAGPDTPWRPGFLAGFHEMLDQLGQFMRGEWAMSDNATRIAEFVNDGPPAEHRRWIETYREHVREHCPPS